MKISQGNGCIAVYPYRTHVHAAAIRRAIIITHSRERTTYRTYVRSEKRIDKKEKGEKKIEYDEIKTTR